MPRFGTNFTPQYAVLGTADSNSTLAEQPLHAKLTAISRPDVATQAYYAINDQRGKGKGIKLQSQAKIDWIPQYILNDNGPACFPCPRPLPLAGC